MDRPLVDDAAQAVAAKRARIASAVGRVHIQSRGHQGAHIDLRALTKQDAIGVDQVDLPIGIEVAKYLAGHGVVNAVDGDR